MKKMVLNDYLTSRLRSVERQLTTYAKDRKPGCLHHLRVDIKKIRAILSFVADIYKENYPGNKLKPLFREAGRIREVGINIRLLGTLPHVPGKYMDQLKKKEKVLQQQFIKNSSRHTKQMERFGECISLPAVLPGKKTIKNYIEKEIRKADKIIRKGKRDDMHLFRKKIKKIMFVSNSLPGALQKALALDTAFIARLQKTVGDWHDAYSALDFLSRQRVSSVDLSFLSALKEKENKRFHTILKLYCKRGSL